MRSDPAFLSSIIVRSVIETGSKKDGMGQAWREESSIYHLIKAASHLATHIKFKIDPRKQDEENHLHKAMARLAMAACIEQNKK